MDGEKKLESFIDELDLEYAIIVGKSKTGDEIAAVYGKPDNFQISGMANYLYNITKPASSVEDDDDW